MEFLEFVSDQEGEGVKGQSGLLLPFFKIPLTIFNKPSHGLG